MNVALTLKRAVQFNCRKNKIINSILLRKYSSVKNESVQVMSKDIYNMYKLNDIKYNNLKIINNYDEYFNLIIKNEYFEEYSKIRSRLLADEIKERQKNGQLDNNTYNNKKPMDVNDKKMQIALEKLKHENSSKNLIISNDLQVLFFGSYENNTSIILFEKFKTIIEKNKKLQFFFIDVNTCPQCSYNCDITYVPCVCLIYKNFIYRKKIQVDYENPINDKFITDFLSDVQQNINTFQSYNNKFIYDLPKESNYLNTKYIDVDNQNIHKENWNTY
ncbi:conserved protein, unknown function [Hepatocystis sp. ex Piliocolobus tephrosceles]|nr:conserved protein, unknown function [Hepatocystis sp. ex Piliocolobus tephrosceles]